MMGKKIFINYRRCEDRGAAGRLFDQLGRHFDRKSIFIDVNNIPYGKMFFDVIKEHIISCDVFIVIIGQNWATMTSKKGTNRLSEPEDLLRIEIEIAIESGKYIIPALVDSAVMPSAENLPKSILSLSKRHCCHLRHENFENDVRLLIQQIRRFRAEARLWARLVAASAIVTLMFVGLIIFHSNRAQEGVRQAGLYVRASLSAGTRITNDGVELVPDSYFKSIEDLDDACLVRKVSAGEKLKWEDDLYPCDSEV